MSRLITFGDSWTAGHGVETEKEYKENPTPPKFIEKLREQNSFPKWLGNLLNISYINLGVCGFGNEYIFNSVKENLKFINKDDLIIIVFSYPHRYKKHNKYTPEELFKKFETILYGYKKFYFNGFYPFIENADFNFPKYYINPKGTLSYQLQVEEMVNKKDVWEYGSKMVWNDEENYYEGDYHPNLQGYKLIGEYIYKEIENLL
jgi:lysophospholipase L1-like esterase